MTEERSSYRDTEALLEQLSVSLPAAIAELEETQARIASELQRLRRAQKALVPEDQRSLPAKVSRKPRSPSPGVILRVAEMIVDRTDEFTVQDIAKAMGISDPTVYLSFGVLRDMEFIAKVGQASPIRKGVKGRAVYRVLDTHVLDQLRSQHATQGSHQS